ncbi:hypothetical protein KY348_07370 [Candidatus Woesearchaeota archaeon]|nr:hypothetical protein [Candidatus Woesearchaeota archaeon]
MNEFLTRCEKRFRFTNKELFGILISVVVAAFVLSFKLVDAGGSYAANFIVLAILLLISFLIHFSAQKLVALKLGYESRYKYWLNGILLSLVVCFFTYGYFPLFFTGSLWHQDIPKLRIGVFRGGVRHKDLGLIAFAGPFSNMIIALLLAPVFLATKSSFVQAVIIINLLIAIYSLIPVPTFEKLRQFKGGTTGLYLFIASRWAYVLVLATFVAYAVLLWLIPGIFSFIIALILGIITTIIYYSQYESDK